MNIRSIIGLTALTPYIVGASLLVTSACAPKSRYRGPVNVAGVGPVISPEVKTQANDDTEAKIKDIEAQLAADPVKKAETEKLNTQLQDIDIDIQDSEATVLLTLKDENGEQIASYTGPIAQGSDSELQLSEEGKTDVKISSTCFDKECAIVDISIKKGNVVIPLRVSKGVTSAAVVFPTPAEGAAPQSDDDKLLTSKLSQISTAQVTMLLNLVNKKEAMIVAISQELEDKSKVELSIKGSTEVSEASSLSIVENIGLEKISKAKLAAKVGKNESLDIALSSEGETPFLANLKLGKEAGDIQQLLTEAKLKKEQEAADAAAKKAEQDKLAADQAAATSTETTTSTGTVVTDDSTTKAASLPEKISDMNFEDGNLPADSSAGGEVKVEDTKKEEAKKVDNKAASISTQDDDDVMGGSQGRVSSKKASKKILGGKSSKK